MSALVGERIRRNALAGCGSLILTIHERVQAIAAKFIRLLRHNDKDSRRHAIRGLPLGCAWPHAVYYSIELNRSGALLWEFNRRSGCVQSVIDAVNR